MKKIEWMSSFLSRLREFPTVARQIIGRQLRRVQDGKEPADWRPMPSIGPGVKEIRVHRPHEHRVIYGAQFPEAIFVLHAFEKKTQKTLRSDIELARKNYAEIEAKRKEIQQTNQI